MLIVTRARASLVARFVVGSLLLLPAFLAFGLVLWYPALHTLALSLQSVMLERPGRFAGLVNYLYLWHDPLFGPAVVHSILVALARLTAGLSLPVLVGWLWARRGPWLRLLARLALSLGLALSAPAGLGLLWRVASPRIPWLRGLSPGQGAHPLASYLLLEMVAFLGLGGGLAATALLSAWQRPRSGRAVWGVLALTALLALSSGLNASSLSFVATGGGPQGRTMTLALYAFRTAFQGRQIGYAAAQASLLLLAGLALGLLFGAISEGLRLRLIPALPTGGRWAGNGFFPCAVIALGSLLLPLGFLYLWGAAMAFLSPGDPLAHINASLQPGVAVLNGALVPILAIVLLQLPISYLAALSLALVRPYGEWGSRAVFVLLVASGFVPPVVTAIGLFDPLRWAHWQNTLPAFGLPLLASAASLFILKLYFSGQELALEQARRSGQPAANAFLRFVLRPSLPIVGLAGAVSLLLAGQDLLWPVLMLASSEYFPLSLQLVVFQSRFASNPVVLAAGAWLVLTCWGLGMLALWWPLQTLVLERLALVAD